MRRKTLMRILFLLMFTAILLTGCKAPEMEFDTADEAKEALDTASVIEIYSDLDSSRRKTKILADGKVAGYLQGNTVYIDGEEWFHIDYAKEESVYQIPDVSSSTTYGYYDAENQCLGYAQKRYLDTKDGGRDEFLIFLDVDGTLLDYCSTDDGEVLFDGEGNAVGTGNAGKEGVSLLKKFYTNIYRTVFETDPQANMTVEFMDRMAMYKCLQEDIRWIYNEPVNTGVEIYGTVAVLLIIILSIVYVKKK